MNNMLKYTKMLLLFVLVLGLTSIVRKKRNIICPVNGIHLKK